MPAFDGTKWDVYSFAIMAATLLTERQPYAGMRNFEICVQVWASCCSM